MYALIEGGFKPVGTVEVSGAKNSATRLLAASLLTEDEVNLTNFPTELVDAQRKVRFMRTLGARVDVDKNSQSVTVQARAIDGRMLTGEELDVPIRTTYLLAAGQLARHQVAKVPYPGGCPIGGGTGGGRGYDLHIMVWEQLGCTVAEESDHIAIHAPVGLQGGYIDFPISTVGGTENAVLCGSVASGVTVIRNAYITPEVTDLVALLRRMGADIEITGTSHIVVRGNPNLLSGARLSVMPDRIEALTWITLSLLTNGNINIKNVPFDYMHVPLLHLAEAGVDLACSASSIIVGPDSLPAHDVQPFEVACGTYPGVISDMQALFVMLGLVAQGTSRIHDYRYPDRIAFAGEVAKLVDAERIVAERGKITTRGRAKFVPGRANSTDLRGSMAVVMASLAAEGESRVDNVQMALRGYNRLEYKLRELGCNIAVHEDLD